jgi:hypothetical protein
MTRCCCIHKWLVTHYTYKYIALKHERLYNHFITFQQASTETPVTQVVADLPLAKLILSPESLANPDVHKTPTQSAQKNWTHKRGTASKVTFV